MDEATGWPACLVVTSSLSGLDDVFYIKGRRYKGKGLWGEETWIAGTRPKGSDYLPVPVQAILILEKLYRPWRDMAGKTALLVSLGTGAGFPNYPSTIGNVASGTLRDWQNSWIRKWADIPWAGLPEELQSWSVTTSQWRKSFAQYMIRTDSRMLPDISRHFKHMSIAVTEMCYISNDPQLLGLVDDAGFNYLTVSLHEMITGKTQPAGKFAEFLRQRRKEVLHHLEGRTREEQLKIIEEMIVTNGLRVWQCELGDCYFRPETSRCNHINGEIDWQATRPDTTRRNPETCCKCANLVVDSGHKAFWLDRLTQVSSVYDAHKVAGNVGMALVAAKRLRQCRSVLRMMGEDMLDFTHVDAVGGRENG